MLSLKIGRHRAHIPPVLYIHGAPIKKMISGKLRKKFCLKLEFMRNKIFGSSDYSVDRFNTNIEIKFYGI